MPGRGAREGRVSRRHKAHNSPPLATGARARNSPAHVDEIRANLALVLDAQPMKFVQPKRDRFPIPPHRQLERVVDPPVVVVLPSVVGFLRLRRRRRRRRFGRFARLEFLNLDRALTVRQGCPALRVGERVGEDGAERSGRRGEEGGDERFFERERAVLVVSQGGQGRRGRRRRGRRGGRVRELCG